MKRVLTLILAIALALGTALGVWQAMRGPRRLGQVRDQFAIPTSFEASVSGVWGNHDLPDRFAMQLEAGRPVRYRAEHGEFIALVDVGSGEMLVYAPGENEALCTDVGDVLGEIALLGPGAGESNARILGHESVDGVECWIVRPEGDDTRFWLGREDGLVRRVEGGFGSVNLAYARIDTVPAEEFELPEGMTVREMDEAFGQMVGEEGTAAGP